MSQETNVKTLDFVEATGKALSRAEKLAADINQEKQAALKLSSPVIESLVQHRLIDETEREMAATKLASHDGAMELLKNLVVHYGQQKEAAAKKEALSQGSPIEGNQLPSAGEGQPRRKTAAVGQRAGLGERRESDEPFLRLAGLA